MTSIYQPPTTRNDDPNYGGLPEGKQMDQLIQDHEVVHVMVLQVYSCCWLLLSNLEVDTHACLLYDPAITTSPQYHILLCVKGRDE
jgi:hypothetical protein